MTEIIGSCAAIEEAKQRVRRVAREEMPMCLLGESGTGKEVFAKYIHQESGREDECIALNCAVTPDALLPSELFGHEKGAFTGATEQRKGVFERAGKGTVFLDEIGTMPADSQAKLLRILDGEKFRRVGGEDLIRNDARVIVATNEDLADMREEGTFREDLYWRVAKVIIKLPPLRERGDDIVELAQSFWKGLSRADLPPFNWEVLKEYEWPGNIRELKSFVEYAYVNFVEGVEEEGFLKTQLCIHRIEHKTGKEKPGKEDSSIKKFEPFFSRLGLSETPECRFSCALAEYLVTSERETRKNFIKKDFKISDTDGLLGVLVDGLTLTCLHLAPQEEEEQNLVALAITEFGFDRMTGQSSNNLSVLQKHLRERLRGA